MLVKGPVNFKVEEVALNQLSDWKSEYKRSLGDLVIACSQWEYVYELLWKDMNPNPSKPFLEVIKDADKEVGYAKKNFLEPLSQDTDNEAINLCSFISHLETRYKDLRHLMVHGFHHQHNGDVLVTRLSHRSSDIVGEMFDFAKVEAAAKDINTTVRKINDLRRKKFHAGANAFAVSAASK